MRVARVGVVGMMMVTALTVGCAAKKRAVVPVQVVADEDRLDWAVNEPDFIVIRKSCRTLDVYRYGHVLKARQLVGVRGAGEAFDGLHFVTSVSSSLKRGEFTQSFSLARNGLVSTLPAVPA